MAITVEARTSITELVVGMFGAAPGARVLSDLVAAYEAGMTIKQMAANLANTNEFKGIFQTFLTNGEFATKVVNQLLAEASTTAKAEAVTVLTAELNGGMSRSDAFVAAINFVNGTASTNTTYGTSAAAFDNKVEVATYYSVEKALSGSSLQALQNVVGAVTSSATTVTTAKASVDNVQTPGSTFTLTASADAGAAFTAGAGNDTFNALATTLNTGDSLVGGAGTDTLSLSVDLTANTAVAGFILSGIERVNVAMTDGDGATAETLTMNMVNSDASTLAVSGLGSTTAEDTVTFNNVAAGTTIAMANATDLNVTANFVAAATAGTANTVSVSLNGAASTAAGDSDLTIGSGFETINVAISGAASRVNDIVTTSATTMNISGDQNLTVRAALDASLATVNASALTGNLSVVVGDRAAEVTNPSTVDLADLTLTGGVGNDTIDASTATTATQELRIDGGAGNDTVTIGQVVANASATTVGDVLMGGEGADTLAGDVDLFDGGTAGFTGTTAATGISGFETLSLSGFDAEANIVNVSNISADITTIKIGSATGGNTTLNFGTAGAYTVNVGGNAAILDDDTLTVDAAGTGTADSLTISNANAATGTAQIGANDTNITATDFETVTINTGSYSTATAQLVNAINVGTNALVLTGSNGLTTTATTGIITASSINASAMTGALIMNVAAATGLTSITGGSAGDTLRGDSASTISGGGGNDTIVGGTGSDTLNGNDGNDNITTGTGNDTVSGGAGNDTIVAAGNLSALDTIDGGDGTDTLSVTGASLTALAGLSLSEANAFNTGLVSVEALTLTDALNQTTFDLGRVDGLDTITLEAGFTGDETLSGLNSGNTVKVQAAPGNATDILTLTVNNASTSTTDALTVSLTGSATVDYGVLALANIETMTINVTEVTASTNIRAGTVGLTITQAAGGSAQTVNITGTESLTVDTAIAAGTINASGMTVAAATDAGLTMSTGHTAAQTITGSGKVDTIYGSTKADTINAGAGADAIYASTGADTIDGGTGLDTLYTTGLVGGNIEGTGTGTSVGTVVNLGSTAVTGATVFTATGDYLGGGLTSAAAGSIAYTFNTESSLHTTVVKTVSNVENITLSGNGVNYVVGSDAANVITGGSGVDTIIAGNGADTVTGAGGNDVITLTETAANSAVDTVIFSNTAGNNGVDTITGFTTLVDKLNVDAFGTAVAITTVTGAQTNTVNNVYFLGGQAAGAADTIANSVTALAAAGTWTDAAATSYIIVVDDNSTAIYEYLGDAGGDDFTAGEFTLMATVDAVIVAGDLLFA